MSALILANFSAWSIERAGERRAREAVRKAKIITAGISLDLIGHILSVSGHARTIYPVENIYNGIQGDAADVI
jgi:hypothetical protein